MNLLRAPRTAVLGGIAVAAGLAVTIPSSLGGSAERPALPASMSDLPPEKREAEIKAREVRENAPRAAKPDPDEARPVEAQAAKPWPRGLFQEVEAPAS